MHIMLSNMEEGYWKKVFENQIGLKICGVDFLVDLLIQQ